MNWIMCSMIYGVKLVFYRLFPCSSLDLLGLRIFPDWQGKTALTGTKCSFVVPAL